MDTPRYRPRYEQLREGDPTSKEGSIDPNSEELMPYYDQPGHMRNVCFVWPDGRRVFISYAYLISGELTIDDDLNKIVLTFSNQIVIIKGYELKQLFVALMKQMVLYIMEKPAFFNTNEEQHVTNIAICTNQAQTIHR